MCVPAGVRIQMWPHGLSNGSRNEPVHSSDGLDCLCGEAVVGKKRRRGEGVNL